MKDLKIFIDTNIFLRALTADQEKEFHECVAFLKDVKAGKIKAFTSTLVLAELQWTLKSFYKFTKEETLTSLYGITSLKNLKILNDPDPTLGLELYRTHPVKLIDAFIASYDLIQDKKMAIVSYDKDFDRLGVKRLEPRNFL